MSFNQVILIGNLGKDPETIHSKGGSLVCKFSLATTERYNKENKTEWHRIVAFGKLAEICQQYLEKGKQVCIVGKITTNTWEKDGVTHYMTEIIANEMRMLGGKGEGRAQQQAPARPETHHAPDNDIPF